MKRIARIIPEHPEDQSREYIAVPGDNWDLEEREPARRLGFCADWRAERRNSGNQRHVPAYVGATVGSTWRRVHPRSFVLFFSRFHSIQLIVRSNPFYTPVTAVCPTLDSLASLGARMYDVDGGNLRWVQ